MPTIEAGIGTIIYHTPTNLKLQHLMEQLKDNIETSNPDEVLEYLDEYKNADERKKEKERIKDLEERVYEAEKENKELKDEVEELEEKEFESDDEIDCGIGTIEFTADNLLLQQLMENLKDAIEANTPLEVMRMLEEYNKKKLAA